MPQDNQLALFQRYNPARNLAMSESLIGIAGAIETAALANVNAVPDIEDYTETERQAMLVIEKLKQVNGLDLTSVLLRAQYIREIEQSNALTNHPAGYQSRAQMARDQGISEAELSKCADLAFVIFPYVQETLGIPVATMWEQIGKSNFGELIPVLKQIITGEESDTATARRSADHVLDDVAATAQAAGQELEEGELQARAVAQLLDDGANLTNRELRQRIRPERTESIQASVVGSNGNRFVVAQMSEEQYQLLQRRMGSYMDTHSVDLPTNPVARQQEAARIPEIRLLMRYLEGS